MVKSSGPNWKNIRKMRDHLASMRQTKYKKFNMQGYITVWMEEPDSVVTDSVVTVKQLRSNGPACGSAVCIAGETVIQLASPALELRVNGSSLSGYMIHDEAEKILGLDHSASMFMFAGRWSKKLDRSKITRKEAARYLDRVLKERNVFVYEEEYASRA